MIIGTPEHISGAHPFIGIAVFVEVRNKCFGQRVVQQLFSSTIMLLQLLKLEALLFTVVAPDHNADGPEA